MATPSALVSQPQSNIVQSALRSPKKLAVRINPRNDPDHDQPCISPARTAINTSLLLSTIQGTSSSVEDSNEFLTALATQERRVLELKEELHKAEEDLEKLQKQWTTHEITKKRSEIRNVEQLRSLRVGSPLNRHGGSSPGSIYKEHERQRALKSEPQQAQRKVFPGSRQTRALSLLSPNPFNEKKQTQSHIRAASLVNSDEAVAKPLSRCATTPALAPTFNIACHASSKNVPKEAILETGKQLVGDLRGGLWTFFEDLRQATVGEEAAVSPLKVKKAKYSRSKEVTQQSINVRAKRKARPERSQPTEDGQPSYQRDINDGGKLDKYDNSSNNTVNHVKRQNSGLPNDSIAMTDTPQHGDVCDDGGWDNWDSPKSKHQSPRPSVDNYLYTPEMPRSPSTGKTSPRTSIRYA